MDSRKDFVAFINTIAQKDNPLGKKALVAITERKDAADLLDFVVNEAQFSDVSLEECTRLIENREALKWAGNTMSSAIKNGSY